MLGKKQKEFILVILTFALAIFGCFYIYENFNSPKEIGDGKKFKNEYERYNGEMIEGSSLKYLPLSIPRDNLIKYVTIEEVIELLQTGTGVFYFGYPTCPWCRNIVPSLLSSASEVGIEQIYYYNALEIRDKKHLDIDGNIVVDKEGSPEYQKLLKLLDPVLGPYEGLNDPLVKRLYFPTVVFVRNGKVLGSHVGSVPSQADPMTPLTDEQVEELKKIYRRGIQKTIVCDEAC